MNQISSQNNELKQVARFLNKYKTKLLLVSLVCAALSAGISMLIPAEYKSTAIVFPPAKISLDLSSEDPNFGYDVEADRLLQIFQSTEIRDSLIKKFDLINYYNLNTDDKDWLTKLTIKYQKDVEFKRTTFMSIVISCQSRNPEMSAKMVNQILHEADHVREKIYKQNVKLAYAKINSEYESEKAITDSLLGILQNDIKILNISGLILLAPNAQINFNFAQLSDVKNNGPENQNIGADVLKYRFHLDRQNDYESKAKRISKMLDFPMAQIHVLDKAEPNYKKAFPMITLNVVVSALLGFMFTCLYYILQPKK